MRKLMSRRIDIEPKWADLCRVADRGALKPSFLLPACETADVVRQAQKSGARSVVFSFRSRKSPASVKILRRK
jgi:hypothetical protein